MYKRLVLLFGLIIISAAVFADTCPALSDIQKNKLSGWQVLDSDDGSHLSPERQANFFKSIKQFALAESVQTPDKKYEIHCYYRDSNGSELEAYLSKADLIPKNNQDDWYQVSGAMDCAASIDECLLQKNVVDKPQVATNATDSHKAS